MSMSILYLHQYFATPDSNGGTRSYEMAKRFIRNGHKVTIVTSSAFFSNKSIFNHGWNELEIEGIRLFVLHLPYSNKDSYISRIGKFFNFSVRATIKALTVKADVALATSTPLTIAVPGVIYSKVKGVPMVFEVRDLWPELPVAVGALKNRLAIRMATWLERFAYNNAKRLVGLSPGMCDGIIRTGIEPERVILATNSCDTELFDVPSSVGDVYKIEKMPFVGQRKLIVYTGTFGVINNVKYMVDLAHAASVSRMNLCFVAIGDGMQKEDVLTYAKEKSVLDMNFYVLDAVPKTEIVSLLSAADLALSLFGPIKEMWHNSANKLFDALAAGTPIAINYGGWQKDLIETNRCGVVLDANDCTKSVLLLSQFLSDSEIYESAKKSCHHLAYNEYSRDIMAAKLESALLQAVNG